MRRGKVPPALRASTRWNFLPICRSECCMHVRCPWGARLTRRVRSPDAGGQLPASPFDRLRACTAIWGSALPPRSVFSASVLVFVPLGRTDELAGWSPGTGACYPLSPFDRYFVCSVSGGWPCLPLRSELTSMTCKFGLQSLTHGAWLSDLPSFWERVVPVSVFKRF